MHMIIVVKVCCGYYYYFFFFWHMYSVNIVIKIPLCKHVLMRKHKTNNSITVFIIFISINILTFIKIIHNINSFHFFSTINHVNLIYIK